MGWKSQTDLPAASRRLQAAWSISDPMMCRALDRTGRTADRGIPKSVASAFVQKKVRGVAGYGTDPDFGNLAKLNLVILQDTTRRWRI